MSIGRTNHTKFAAAPRPQDDFGRLYETSIFDPPVQMQMDDRFEIMYDAEHDCKIYMLIRGGTVVQRGKVYSKPAP